PGGGRGGAGRDRVASRPVRDGGHVPRRRGAPGAGGRDAGPGPRGRAGRDQGHGGGGPRDARVGGSGPALRRGPVEAGARGACARRRGQGRGRRGAHAREPAAGHRRRRRVRLRARRRGRPPGRHPAQPGGERQKRGTARARAEPGRGRVTGGVIKTFTPLRVPFAGGLTDLKEYAERFGGVTVSGTIDRGAKVTARTSDGPWRVT